MLLSIIVPIWNEAACLEERLQQLQVWRSDRMELILVDGGSTDQSAIIAKPLCDQFLHAPQGRAIQMNHGTEAARGRYLLFLHVDTHLPVGFEQAFIHWSSTQPLWGFSPVRLSGGHWLLRVIETAMNIRSRWTSMATGDQGQIVQHELFLSLGGFPQVPLMEDLLLSRALKKFSRPKLLEIPLMTSSRRWESNGILKTMAVMVWIRWLFWLGVSPHRLATLYSRLKRVES